MQMEKKNIYFASDFHFGVPNRKASLERENKLYGFEYSGEFLHLTDIEIYNKLFKLKD